MAYVEGFVVPVPRKNLAAYRRMAAKAGRVWLDHGALEYRECVADDDFEVQMGRPFPRQLALKRGETVFFSWIVYPSRADRDRVNAKAMKDPRLAAMDVKKMPFDLKRMVCGGFKPMVDLAAGAGKARGARRGRRRGALPGRDRGVAPPAPGEAREGAADRQGLPGPGA